MLRIRQVLDVLRHRLLFIPALGVIVAVCLSQIALRLDNAVADEDVPRVLDTTVDSARSILAAISGGLISSVTLLLSMTLVAVQLASTQFSPRTVRDWTGNRTQQITIAIVLGTAVFCLLILRETRSDDNGDEFIPHLSVTLAMALGVLSLIAVVRSVDHLADSMRIGAVAKSILSATTELIGQRDAVTSAESPSNKPVNLSATSDREIDVPEGAQAITAIETGWIQQIDLDALFEAIPENCTAYAITSLGTFTPPNVPLVWVWPKPASDCSEQIRAAFAVGDTRTMQQDVAFGILQLTDIAVRALSPGINDPNTANDVVAHLGAVLLTLWEEPQGEARRSEGSRTLIHRDLTHDDYLRSVVDPLRTYAMADKAVVANIARMLLMLKSETVRRDLPGPVEPINEQLGVLATAVENSGLLQVDQRELGQLLHGGS